LKRVVLTGSESTGKTTLARRLAEHFGVEWVPEFVREYADHKGAPLTFDDHEPIARGQIALEESYSLRSKERGAGLLVQDTDLLSTAVYCEHYYGECPGWLLDLAHERRPDLYLLMDTDIPWIADAQRDRGHRRPEMHALFEQAVQRSGAPWVLVSGDGEHRFLAGRAAVEEMLNHSGRRP
jgi:NadR type nicotinamide-nucleotide adenylyltransferase